MYFVDDADELGRSLFDTVDLVGVNNRNLNTFETSVETSIQLIDQIPSSFVRVTESGLQDAATILRLQEAGYEAFLIGEAFMKTAVPEAALAALVGQFRAKQIVNPF
jgi:indole-3-glycerol phosphate synthase